MPPASSPVSAPSPQQLAADPQHSVWLAASAGTGKTKVLVDRLLRLMLAGASPQRILCLTFTKVGAAEMTDRLHQRLIRWYALPDPLLADELAELLGRGATTAEQNTARQLLDAVLNGDGSGRSGLNIRTIHSFCQQLLQQFAFEAGVPAGFGLLEEGAAQKLQDQALHQLLAANPAGTPLAEAFALLSHHHHLTSLRELLAGLLNTHPAQQHEAVEGEQSFAAYARRLGLPSDDPLTAGQQHWQDLHGIHRPQWVEAARLLATSSGKTDQATASAMQALLAPAAATYDALAFVEWQQLFLTKEHTLRARLLTKACATSHPQLVVQLAAEAERLLELAQAQAAWQQARKNWAMQLMGARFAAQYHALKRQQAKLDYNDLITCTHQLLQQAELQPWVLMSMDQRIEHLLVDEAQDTNQMHWGIIAALLSESVGEVGRQNSLFVVGDVKQSIYSFQGAEPQSFQAAHAVFRRQWQRAQKPWVDVGLHLSYRSTAPILQLVDALFNQGDDLLHALGLEGEGEGLSHQAHPNRQQGGRVVLWPLCPRLDDESLEDGGVAPWALPLQRYTQVSQAKRLAGFLAQQIAGWLAEQRWLPSVQRAVQPCDVMILVQQRSAGGSTPDKNLLHQLRLALQQQGVACSPAERIVLAGELPVQDLLALMQILLTPDDDYALACVLKSPLVGWSEQQLFDLCQPRAEGVGVWQQLQQSDHPETRALVSWLGRLMAAADWQSPLEFLTQLLWQVLPLHPHQLTGWQAYQAHFGVAVGEGLEALIDQALAYQQQPATSWIGFLQHVRQGLGGGAKRSGGAGRNEVRLMTVHAAKGLQSPIVILADTTSQPRRSTVEALIEENAQDKRVLQDQERLRLLYVALTRAQDELYVTGLAPARVASDRGKPSTHWYGWIESAMHPIAQPIPLRHIFPDATLWEGASWVLLAAG